jgi:hypothetical protein
MATEPIFTAAAAWTALGRAGFRMVEWVTPGPSVRAGLAVRLATRARAAPRAELPLGIAVARVSDRGSAVMPGVVRDSAA